MTDRRRTHRAVIQTGLLAPLCCLAADLLSAAPPSVTSVAPLGIRPGHSAEIVLGGQNLESVSQLWTSWGMSVAAAQAEAGSARFALEIPADVPPGLHAVRVLSPGGVSDLQLIVLDDLPGVAEGAGNQSVETAQALTLPCAVDGRVDNLSRDYYRFDAKAGERLSLEVLARRLGSPLDPALFLYRADGRELAYSDDAEGLSGDAQLEYRFDADGSYVLEVRDIGYAGGAQHVYRLRIGDFPCLNVALPMGVQRGQRTRIDFAGIGVGEANPAWADVPADWPHSWFPVSTRRPDGVASGFTLIAVGDAEEFLEREPNNTAPQANSIALGTQINARFDAPSDIDRYRFEAKKGQRFVFTGVTRNRAAPTDLVLELLDASGKQVARVDDAKTAEGSLDQTFSADGEYVLAASDLHRRGGPQYAYRIEVAPFQPGFELSVAADHLNIPAGGVGSLTVKVERLGHGGEIQLTVEGLPEGWEALPTTIGPGMASGELTVRAPAGAATTAILDAVRVVGTASIGGTIFRATATLADTLRGRWNQVSVIPRNVEQAFAAAAEPPPPFSLTIEPAEVVLGKHLKTTVKVVAQRSDSIDEPIELAAVLDKAAFPPDVTLNVQPIPKGANEVSLELTAGPKSPTGPFTVVLRGTHKKDNATQTAIAAPINYRLDTPLAVTADPGGRVLKRTGQLSVTVHVQRNPALSGEIKLTVAKTPGGVSAAEVIVPADQSSAEIILAATTDAAAGEFTEGSIEAVAVGNDQVTASAGLGKIVIE
ncbi:MAG: hypothetical protein AB7I48_18675 [Planctomycetaceae bacterium]